MEFLALMAILDSRAIFWKSIYPSLMGAVAAAGGTISGPVMSEGVLNEEAVEVGAGGAGVGAGGVRGVVTAASAFGCATDGASSAEKAAVTSEMVSKVVITVSFMDVLSFLSEVGSIGEYRGYPGDLMVTGAGRSVNRGCRVYEVGLAVLKRKPGLQ